MKYRVFKINVTRNLSGMTKVAPIGHWCNARFNKTVARYVHSEVSNLAIGHLEVSGATGSVLYQIALWYYFGDVALLQLAVKGCVGNWTKFRPLNSPIVQFDTTPTQFHATKKRISE